MAFFKGNLANPVEFGQERRIFKELNFKEPNLLILSRQKDLPRNFPRIGEEELRPVRGIKGRSW